MAKYRMEAIPGLSRGERTADFYADLWVQVREAAKKKKAIVVDVPEGDEVGLFANRVRQSANHRVGKGCVGVVQRKEGRQIVLWMK